jgi:hypothetical protein
MLDMLFLEVSFFYCRNDSETLVLAHSVARMIISEKEK